MQIKQKKSENKNFRPQTDLTRSLAQLQPDSKTID